MPKKKGGRANNGMGSIRQRPDGRWEARYTTPDGRQKSIYAKSEKEVTQKLKASLHEVDSGTWREPSKMTVGEWLDVWIRDYQGHTTGRTVQTYKGQIKNYIRPVVGDIKIAKLNQAQVMRVLSEMQDKGLSVTTQRQALITFRSSLKSAIDAGCIKVNPAERVKLPKAKKSKFIIIDRQHIQGFIEAAQKTEFPNEILFMFYTGLRVGELRGLKWSDADLSTGTLNVERQLYTHARGIGFGMPKHGEIRTIEMADEAIDVLKRQRIRQAEQRLAAGSKWKDTDLSKDLIFRQKLGQIHTNVSLARAVKEVGAAIGLPDLHPHDLRHSYAVAALRSGADVKTVQHNMGHKDASVTLNVYAEYTSDAGKVGAKKLSKYLKSTSENND